VGAAGGASGLNANGRAVAAAGSRAGGFEFVPDTSDWTGKFRLTQNKDNDYLIDRDGSAHAQLHRHRRHPSARPGGDREHGTDLRPLAGAPGTSDAMVIRARRRVINAARALRDAARCRPVSTIQRSTAIGRGGVILPRDADWLEATKGCGARSWRRLPRRPRDDRGGGTERPENRGRHLRAHEGAEGRQRDGAGRVVQHVEVSPIVAAFRRMVRTLEFDVSEMAITTYLTAKAHGKAFTALPVFVMRQFHHTPIVYNVKSGVKSPKDLEGKKVGVRAYTVTTGVWARGILATEYGVDCPR
jgi:hypothetical protein